MLDFHSHILPQIDDGAKDVDESIKMLTQLHEQGCERVALTSHYIAMDESPDEFLSRREESYKILTDDIKTKGLELPQLLLGAEVFYYPGVTKMEELSTLTLGDTNLLLLEMPMSPWGEYTIRELTEFAQTSDIQIVIAHIERCLAYQKKDTIERLLDSSVLLQINASFLISRKTRRKALRMIKDEQVHFIGSDCHSIKHRPPRMKEALDIIKDKLGKEYIENLTEFQNSFFNS